MSSLQDEYLREKYQRENSAVCAYCNQSVDRTAGSIADHAITCEKHPIHQLQLVAAERDQLKTIVEELKKEQRENRIASNADGILRQFKDAYDLLKEFSSEVTNHYGSDESTRPPRINRLFEKLKVMRTASHKPALAKEHKV